MTPQVFRSIADKPNWEVVEMGSIAAANPASSSTGSSNPGLADALQLISNSASPTVSSLLSSPNVQAALQNASPGDLIELSDQALQAQVVDGLFGNADGSQTQTDPSTTLSGILSELNPPATSSSTAASTSSASLASQLAIYQDQQQGQDTQALLGPGSNVNLVG
jgi:hypothetical protein